LIGCCKRPAVKTVTVVKMVEVPIPCFEPGDGVPRPAETLRRAECPEGLEVCFDKPGAFDLTNYIADLQNYANRAAFGCTPLSQGDSDETH
jgi:hypothetical protein